MSPSPVTPSPVSPSPVTPSSVSPSSVIPSTGTPSSVHINHPTSQSEHRITRYCVCNEPPDVSPNELFIGCDNVNSCVAKKEKLKKNISGGDWFHYQCVGCKTKPKGKWYCPQCIKSWGVRKKSETIRSKLVKRLFVMFLEE